MAFRFSRIEMTVKPGRDDPAARHARWEIASHLAGAASAGPVRSVRLVRVYTLYSDLPESDIHRFAEALRDPVLTDYRMDRPVALEEGHCQPFTWALEVSFKPGVTDNVGRTAAQVLDMMLGGERGYRVHTGLQYLLDAGLTEKQVRRMGREVLYNDLIEDLAVMDRREFEARGGFAAGAPVYPGEHLPRVERVDLEVSDRELMEISSRRVLALTLAEMRYFRGHFREPEVRRERERLGIGPLPTDAELECFAQTQSEHCKHKIFNAEIEYHENGGREIIHSLFTSCIQEATRAIDKKELVVSVFKDNAGVIRFDEEHNLAFKVETHNSPSALDPYGGAITGIVGCDRDPAGTGLGARVIAHTDVLCFGRPDMSAQLPPRMMHPRRIMEGVIKGIEDGGNKCGIPTVNGALLFDDSYRGKPLVFCGSVGIMPRAIRGRETHRKEARPGDVIVMTGGRIGKDGIHGATFSSEEISETSPSQAVQIGDPITQKKMLDMLVEARDRLLYRAITDNGAGGLSSSVGEMARLSGGARLELDKAPLKYPGLDPWEILLSEAQERMTLAVPPEHLDELLALARSRDVLAVPMGEFTGSGCFHVLHRGETVAWLPLDFLHADIPLRLRAVWEKPRIREKPPALPSIDQALRELVSDLNACSREPLIRRYDHEVGGGAVVKPLVGPGEQGPSDGGVIAPVPGSSRGFVLSAGINPFYSRADAFHMAAHAVDEAVRNAVAVGADPDQIALLDNFCWPDPVADPVKTPDGEHKLAQLVRAARGLRATAVAYGAPFISGKDSMKNDYKVGEHKVSVLPTVLVSALGLVPDITRCVTSDFKAPGHPVYLLGATGTALGESLLYRRYGGVSGRVPEVVPTEHLALYRAYFGLAREVLLASGHDLSEGGLALALVECCIGGGVGARVDLAGMRETRGLSPVEALFAETPGRLLASVRPDRERRFLDAVAGLPHVRLGATDDSGALRLFDGEAALASAPVSELAEQYRDPLYDLLGMERGDGECRDATRGNGDGGRGRGGRDGAGGGGHG